MEVGTPTMFLRVPAWVRSASVQSASTEKDGLIFGLPCKQGDCNNEGHLRATKSLTQCIRWLKSTLLTQVSVSDADVGMQSSPVCTGPPYLIQFPDPCNSKGCSRSCSQTQDHATLHVFHSLQPTPPRTVCGDVCAERLISVWSLGTMVAKYFKGYLCMNKGICS